MTCEATDPFIDWMLVSFAYTDDYFDYNYLTTNGQLKPSFNEFFAIDHPPGTQVHTLVVFNANISPPDGSTFSTAGLYECISHEYKMSPEPISANLAVIRK